MTAKEKLIKIVEGARGDDLERAERAFGRFSQEQMKEEHGESGRTRAEILDAYKKERNEWNQAYALAKSI